LQQHAWAFFELIVVDEVHNSLRIAKSTIVTTTKIATKVLSRDPQHGG